MKVGRRGEGSPTKWTKLITAIKELCIDYMQTIMSGDAFKGELCLLYILPRGKGEGEMGRGGGGRGGLRRNAQSERVSSEL